MRLLKIIVEKHTDGYVAYPVGLKGTVVGEGDTFDEAVADITSAIKFHIETFGAEEFETEEPVLRCVHSESRRCRLVERFPVDAPKRKVIRAWEILGFRVLREGNHISMIRENPDGSRKVLTLPNHRRIKGST